MDFLLLDYRGTEGGLRYLYGPLATNSYRNKTASIDNERKFLNKSGGKLGIACYEGARKKKTHFIQHFTGM
jgi:hypothetical protein